MYIASQGIIVLSSAHLSAHFIAVFLLAMQWLSAGVSRASDKEQAELGKTEISLLNFSVSDSY